MTTLVTRDLMKVLRADIDAALIAVAAKHNVSIALGSGKYGDGGSSGSFKLEIAAAGPSAPMPENPRPASRPALTGTAWLAFSNLTRLGSTKRLRVPVMSTRSSA